jgi:hypothetical protein
MEIRAYIELVESLLKDTAKLIGDGNYDIARLHIHAACTLLNIAENHVTEILETVEGGISVPNP